MADDYNEFGHVWHIRGNWRDDSGLLGPDTVEGVTVDAAGVARCHYTKEVVTCERWGDGDTLTWPGASRSFSADPGEFKRAGIKPVLCGSAAQEAV